MDRELSVSYKQSQRTKRVMQGGGILLTLFAVAFLFRLWLRPSIQRSDIQTVITDRGDIEATITASGTVLPEFEEVLTSPVTSRILHVFHNVGETVNAGEVILEIDKKNEQYQLDKLIEELASKENQKKKLQLSIERTLIDLQTNYEVQQLQLESLNTVYQNEKYINSLGGSTKEMVKQAELNAKIAQLEITHLRQSIENQKASLQTDLKDQGFAINIQKKDIEALRNRILGADIKASATAVVTWINDKIGSTVSMGEGVVKLSNLLSFKVVGNISDIYQNRLAVGKRVKLDINDSVLMGTISSINPTVQSDGIVFTVMPSQKNHPSLRSNQKVDIQIITSLHRRVVRLPRKNWINKGAASYLFVVKGNRAIRRAVQFGESNFEYIEIRSGIAPGEEVIISDMENQMHQKEIKIND